MKKLDPALSDPPEHELVIHLPPKVKIESVVSSFFCLVKGLIWLEVFDLFTSLSVGSS
jgi:hypothetical protein